LPNIVMMVGRRFAVHERGMYLQAAQATHLGYDRRLPAGQHLGRHNSQRDDFKGSGLLLLLWCAGAQNSNQRDHREQNGVDFVQVYHSAAGQV
jgi:hypothetical protein